MSRSMRDLSVPVFDAMLANLSAVLGKAAEHAAARGFDPSVLLQSRLYPDMLPLLRQVQIACDAAKYGVARLTGTEAPRDPDDETSIEQLQARIGRVRAFLAVVPAQAFEGSESRRVEVPVRTQVYAFHGRDFLLRWAMPNFYFHMTTAYALLRHNGVELGKRDYLGQLPVL